MVTKSHCGGNFFGTILHSSGLWAGLQRCESRGISSAFLSVHHPSSQGRAGCRHTVKMEGLETLGSFLLLLGFLLVMVLVAWWAGAKALYPRQDESGVQRAMPGTVPRMGGWPEMLIHLWAQRGSAPLDSSLAASSQVGQELWSWLCECQTLFLKQPKCTENLQEPRVLCFTL